MCVFVIELQKYSVVIIPIIHFVVQMFIQTQPVIEWHNKFLVEFYVRFSRS